MMLPVRCIWHSSKLCWHCGGNSCKSRVRSLALGLMCLHVDDVLVAYDMNHEKDVRTKIETVRGQVEFGSWQDVQKAHCDFIDRRFHLAEDYRVIDIDEYITNSLVKSRVAQAGSGAMDKTTVFEVEGSNPDGLGFASREGASTADLPGWNGTYEFHSPCCS